MRPRPTPPRPAEEQHLRHFLRMYEQYQAGVRSVSPLDPREPPINPNFYLRFIGPGTGKNPIGQ
jgi:hypothetical protein